MQVFRDLNELTFNNAVLTIGTFDGVHTGHQKIIERLDELAREINGENVILTFHPHPRLIINPDDHTLKLLSTLDEKIELLKHYGINNLIIAPFSEAFSKMTAEAYVKDFLVGKIHPKTVVIGYNHKFGNNREGDIHLLQEMGKQLEFKVVEIPKQEVDHISVSSTKIREALQNGDIDLATSLLGHYYSVSGTVVKGDQRGKKIGFPTANILVQSQNKLIPGNGVYAVRAAIDGTEHPGMLNIGIRPTFNGKNVTIEVHIFNFNEDIYGKTVLLDFIGAIRKEQKFGSVEKLVEQLEKDKKASEKILQDIG